MLPLVVTLFCLSLGAQAQLNPLGRFGKCIDVPTDECSDKDMTGTWYMQYRPENCDHGEHSCQAIYEQKITPDCEQPIWQGLLYYYYRQTCMHHNPQKMNYHPQGKGIYRRAITCDDKAVNILMKVLEVNTKEKYRVVYFCADDCAANPDIMNVQIHTKEQNPCNLEKVLKLGKKKLKEASCKFDVPLMRTEQSTKICKPLDVTKRPSCGCS